MLSILSDDDSSQDGEFEVEQIGACFCFVGFAVDGLGCVHLVFCDPGKGGIAVLDPFF